MWKQDAGRWLNRRSEDAKRCATDLIDHMITEIKKIYATRASWGPRGAERRRRGLRSVLAIYTFLGLGGTHEAISSSSFLPK